MEPLDTLLQPELLGMFVFSLIIVVDVTLLAILLLRRLVKINPLNVPVWVWTLLVFFMVWTTQYVLTALLNP